MSAVSSFEYDTTTSSDIGDRVQVSAVTNGTELIIFDGTITQSQKDIATGYFHVTCEQRRNLGKTYRAQAYETDYTGTPGDGPALPIVFGHAHKYQAPEWYPKVDLTLMTDMVKTSTSVLISNGDQMPQGTSVQVIFGGIYSTGTFNGEEFTLSSFNDSAGTVTLTPVGGTEVATLTEDGVCLVDMYVFRTNFVNYCYKQTGKNCYFLALWPAMSSAYVGAYDTAACQRDSWGYVLSEEAVRARFWTWSIRYLYESLIWLKSGTRGRSASGLGYEGEFCASVTPGTVAAVYAEYTQGSFKAKIKLSDTLYSVTDRTITGVGTCKVVKIWPPLSQRPNSKFGDEVWVSFQSSVGRDSGSVLAHLASKCDLSVSTTGSWNWTVDTVWYGDTVIEQMVDALSYETVTPMYVFGASIKVMGYTTVSPRTYADDNTYSSVDLTHDDSEAVSEYVVEYRKAWDVPPLKIRSIDSSIYQNKQQYTNRMINNKVQAAAAAHWWWTYLQTQIGYKVTLDHTYMNVEPGDRYDTGLLIGASINFMDPAAELTIRPAPNPLSAGEGVPSPIVTSGNTYTISSDAGNFNGPATQVTTGVIVDGNTLSSASSVYGCRTYLGSSIATETPACLSSSAAAGDYTSGVDGICRVKVGNMFVLAYSTLTSWIEKDRIVQLGDPIAIGYSTCSGGSPSGYTNVNGKIYPIIVPGT